MRSGGDTLPVRFFGEPSEDSEAACQEGPRLDPGLGFVTGPGFRTFTLCASWGGLQLRDSAFEVADHRLTSCLIETKGHRKGQKGQHRRCLAASCVHLKPRRWDKDGIVDPEQK